ncbi:MAG: DUF190 domain-containing protein [Aquificaceae bacterium]|nr:DUF190 domain-containing protein [Aquificaceae bacterium]MCX8075815.1 DUF190 domain-containing protein [Aquificaceae bacterium]MDW8095274.1 DUF190 domain-containing protein [Aquificaceae bacterium]MDW8433352.1 DUF190 domain-containing protein [Aquificaceae bacterium]
MGYVLVRLFMREDDKIEGEPAYRKVFELLKEHKVKGATVLKSIMGYGTTGEYHYEGIEALSYALPVVVEFVEDTDKAMEVLNILLAKVDAGLIIVEEVELCYSSWL